MDRPLYFTELIIAAPLRYVATVGTLLGLESIFFLSPWQLVKVGRSLGTPIQGLLERKNRKRNHSRVIVKPLINRTQTVLQTNVRAMVEGGANVLTDEWSGYQGLHTDYAHQVINHAVQYVDGHIHTNGLENFWALLKRTIKGTHVHVAPFHLFRYLDDQAYRFNERKHEDGDQGRFVDAVSNVTGRRITYKQLTGRDVE